MPMTKPFPKLLCIVESMGCEISAVDKMWIKHDAAAMFPAHSVSFKIAPVSVATQMSRSPAAAMTALVATAR